MAAQHVTDLICEFATESSRCCASHTHHVVPPLAVQGTA